MIRLESCGHSLYLQADLPGLLDILQRIFSPGIAVTLCDSRPEDTLLLIVCLDARLKAWTVPADAPCYIIDQGKIVFSLEDIRHNSATYVKHADEGAAPIKLATSAQANWCITIASSSPEDLRGLARLVRYLLGNLLFRCGAQFLHASAVAINGQAYLFAGDSGSGKSSLMFKCCTALGGAFISDDLVCLWMNEQNEMVVSGWPKRVAVGTNLIEPNSQVAQRLARRANTGTRHYQDDIPNASWSASQRSRMRFDSAEFLEVFGIQGLHCAPLAAVVLPQANPTSAGWTIERLPPDAVIPYITQGEATQIRYVTDVMGLFKGAEVAPMQPPSHIVPTVKASYGPDINHAFEHFWNDLIQKVILD